MDSHSDGTRGKKAIVVLVVIAISIGVTYMLSTNYRKQVEVQYITIYSNNTRHNHNGARTRIDDNDYNDNNNNNNNNNNNIINNNTINNNNQLEVTLKNVATSITMSNQQPSIHLPHQHVYYLKTHKTGSTTMHNILAEYCRAHDLTPLLPSHGNHINQGGQFSPGQVKVFHDLKKYDMVFSHHIYSPKLFKYMHVDTFNITTLREPFTAFVSAFLYYRNMWHTRYLAKVPTSDTITEFLRHPEKYEVKGPGTWTNNRQCIDMGYDFSKGFKNMAYIKEFVERSDSRFNLVIIMEYFDEGLVLLKRQLHWKTEDILYIHRNGGTYYKKDVKNSKDLEAERRKLFAKFSQADIMLYNHFLKRFRKAMEGQFGLDEEVAEFKDILVKFRDYCSHMRTSSETLVIPAGKWTNAFHVTKYKCKMVQKDFKPNINFLRARENEVFTR